MAKSSPAASTRSTRIIKAPRERVYRAFVDPADLAVWLPPGEMTGEIHSFEASEGGGYEMSLFYPPSEPHARGKTSDGEDRVIVRFIALVPTALIVEGVTFRSDDPAYAGEMILSVTFAERQGATEVALLFENLPPGLRPEDNEEGARLSLENLARHLE
jgi:uncharacterized protein YndB with AHSA1/START domain